jgi:hypothetical protein
MKPIQIIALFLFVLTVSAKAQLLLNPGDVYTYTFHSLPEVVPALADERNIGGMYFHISSYDPTTDFLFVEMFENSTNDPIITSFVAEYIYDGSGGQDVWADLQGTVRFTMLSGSVTLESITTFYQVPFTAESSQRHQLTFIPLRGTALLEQRVPCAGPTAGGQWRNHGDYVTTLNKVAKELIAQGLLTNQESQDFLHAASLSGCGKK